MSHPGTRMKRSASICSLHLLANLALAAGPGGVKLDGTIGGAAQVLAGPTYGITQNLGKLSGGNLFFSFQYFNVGTGETALFTTTSSGINNVISRVTGGYASTIDGTISLQAAYGAPNFFLINPSGVTFTANAVVNVPAAFNVTTANYLKFTDGNFYVDPSRASTLSTAAPEAFGFLGTTRAPVNVLGANLSAGLNGAGTFQIAAGDVTIDGEGGQTVNGVLEPLGVSNTTGDIRVAAVGGAATEVPLSGPFAATDGTVTIRNGGGLITQGVNSSQSGNIEVTGGSLLIDGLGLVMNGNFQTGITTSTDVLGAGSDSAGSVTVNVAGDATLVNGGAIGSQTFGSGNAGNVSLTTKSLTIDGANDPNVFSGIFEVTESSGSGGNMLLDVTGNASILNGSAIVSESLGSGNAGNISLSAANLTIDSGAVAPFYGGGTGIQDVPVSSGSGGNIAVNVTGNTVILNFGEIYANADGTTGNSGNINLTTGSLTMNGGTYLLSGGLFAGPYFNGGATGPLFSTGSGGNIVVNVAGAASIMNGDLISSDTYSTGNAGNISVSAGSLTIDRSIPYVPLPGGNYPTTGLIANTLGSGSAGRIVLNLGSLAISGGTSNYFVGILSSDGDPTLGAAVGLSAGSGPAGSIVADVTGSVSLQDGGQISTATYGSGPAGGVNVMAGSLSIGGGANPASISSQAYLGSGGQTGQVTIKAGLLSLESNGSIDISNAATVSNTKLITPTQLSISAQEIQLIGGQVTAASTGNVDASTIALQYVQSLQASGGSITTSANQGNGGSVSISGQGPLWLDHSNITTSVTGTSGNGGDINIDVPYVVLNTGAIQANTAASHASGGNLTIDAQAVIPTYESFILGGNAVRFDPASEGLNVVQAAAPDGVSGVLAVTEPTLDLGNSMTGLVGKPSTPTVLGRSPCSYRRGSSLSVAGRGGLPISARDPLWIDAHDFINERAINDSVPATDNNDAPPLPFANSSIHGCR